MVDVYLTARHLGCCGLQICFQELHIRCRCNHLVVVLKDARSSSANIRCRRVETNGEAPALQASKSEFHQTPWRQTCTSSLDIIEASREYESVQDSLPCNQPDNRCVAAAKLKPRLGTHGSPDLQMAPQAHVITHSEVLHEMQTAPKAFGHAQGASLSSANQGLSEAGVGSSAMPTPFP